MPEMLGIGVALQSRLAPFVASPDLQTDIQARYVRTLSVPEYYPEYRDTGNGIAGFLGASIVAKVYQNFLWGPPDAEIVSQIIFNDNGGKNFVSKADYTSKGPHSIIEMTSALL